MRKQFLLIVGSFLFVFASAQTAGQKMEELVTAYAKDGKFNGSVLVAQKGTVLYQKGMGFRNAEQTIMNDANSIFQIGSITKQFTAAIILQLAEEKKLSLKDTLGKYFPGFTNGDKITIEHLLTHTSGMYNYTNDSSLMNGNVTIPISADSMMALFKKYTPDFAPGEKWNYSNSGYSMLGYIISKVTKKPYERVMRERIFNPLKMTNSGFDFTHLSHPNKTKGYLLLGDKIMPAEIVDSTISYSAGAMYSTVGDLAKWERAIYTDKILKPSSWKAAFTPYKNKYGYGWAIDTLFQRNFTAHSGGIPGFASYIIRFPDEELVVIMIDNASSRSLGKISKALAAIALGQPYQMPEEKKAVVVPSTVLQQYVGEYQLSPSFFITITLDGLQLKGQATGQPVFDLFPEKENLFFLKVVEAKVEFIRDEKAVVTELVLYQNGAQPRGKKIK